MRIGSDSKVIPLDSGNQLISDIKNKYLLQINPDNHYFRLNCRDESESVDEYNIIFRGRS